jgi:hypothetical protein
MRLHFNIRQLIWLTTELAVFCTIPIVAFRYGVTIAAIIYAALITTMVGPRLYSDFTELGERCRILHEKRNRMILDLRRTHEGISRRSAPEPHAEKPQSGRS